MEKCNLVNVNAGEPATTSSRFTEYNQNPINFNKIPSIDGSRPLLCRSHKVQPPKFMFHSKKVKHSLFRHDHVLNVEMHPTSKCLTRGLIFNK